MSYVSVLNSSGVDSRVAADGLMFTLYMGWTEDSCPYEVISGEAGGPKVTRLTFFSEDGYAKGLCTSHHGHKIQ